MARITKRREIRITRERAANEAREANKTEKAILDEIKRRNREVEERAARERKAEEVKEDWKKELDEKLASNRRKIEQNRRAKEKREREAEKARSNEFGETLRRAREAEEAKKRDALDCSQAPRNGAGEQTGRTNDNRRAGIR